MKRCKVRIGIPESWFLRRVSGKAQAVFSPLFACRYQAPVLTMAAALIFGKIAFLQTAFFQFEWVARGTWQALTITTPFQNFSISDM